MARYADQLPINLAPNGANFLLATNDSDGKALERIPLELVGGIGGGGSTEYTILDQTALDVDSNIVLSAGLYLYVGNAPANFDLSGLVDGERVEIINHTAHKVFLFGFTNWVWNGTTTALQTDKGLIVEKGGIIGAKNSGNLLLFNTLPNGLAQNYRQGITPPGFYFWKIDFNNILSEIGFYYADSPSTLIRPFGTEIISISPISIPVNNTLPNDGDYENGSYGTYLQTTELRYQLPSPRMISELKIGLLPGYPYFPNNIKLYHGNSFDNWTLLKEWISPSIPGNLIV